MDDRAVVLMSGSELVTAYDTVHDQITELQARGAQILARLDEIGHAKEIGAHDTARLIATRYRLDRAEAHRRVKLANRLSKYPAVAAALPTPGSSTAADGVILHLAQAAAIVSALEQIPSSANVGVEELLAAEEQMVQAARHLTPSELRQLGVQVRNILDTDGPEPREDAARERENVWTKKADGGITFGGYLAGENAARLETVLQHGAKPHKTTDGEPDPRSSGRRQADALSDALTIALGSGDLPGRGGIKPHLAITIDLFALIEAGKNTTGDLTFGDGLSAAAIRRLACDAGVIPIILGSDSQPLDVGREYRFVTTGLRNALNQRDRGCVICSAPPIYCDAHHLVSWVDGGTTSLANSVLLCRVHHTALHQGHWTITITNNQVHITRPTWADRTQPTLQQPPPPPTTDAAPATSPAATTCPTTTNTTTTTANTNSGTTNNGTTNNGCTPELAAATHDGYTRNRTTTTAAATYDGCTPDRATTAAAAAHDGCTPDRATTTATAPVEADTIDNGSADGYTLALAATTASATVDAASLDASTGDSAVTTTDGAMPSPLVSATGPSLAPTRAWPYNNDVSWITPEEAAALDPWSDTDTTAKPLLDSLPPRANSTTPARSSPIKSPPTRHVPHDPWANSA